MTVFLKKHNYRCLSWLYVMYNKKNSDINLKRQKKKIKKAGYTTISCGRAGKGGNARFFSLFGSMVTDGRMDRPTDGQSLL